MVFHLNLRDLLFSECVASGYLNSFVLHVARAGGKAYWHALHLPFSEFETRLLGVAVIELHPESFRFKAALHLCAVFKNIILLVVGLIYWDDNHFNRSHFRRKDEAVVIGMSHDECAHETCADAPGGCPGKFRFVFFVFVFFEFIRGNRNISAFVSFLRFIISTGCKA